jgi:SET domain-containing protein
MRLRKLRVGRSRTGLGLFATAPIAKGDLIVAYRGRRISHAEAERREARGNRYVFEINSRWSIDGSNRRNLARYVNHACRPNAESDLLAGTIILRAIKTIPPGDEITYDYGRDYFELFLRKTGCKCTTCLPRK